MALKVGELFASFNLDTSGIDSAVSSAESKLSSLGKGLAIGGAAMTAAVTAPLKQAASAIYDAGTGFDAQMSKVFAIAGKSVTENAQAMADLRAKALEMGSTTQFTASEAGQAMEYMAMAGWKTEEMLAAIGPLMNLAAASGEELGTTSDIVTDAMTAFGLSANGTTKVLKDGVVVEVNNVAHFADVLAAASSNANTNVSMLGESFKYCGAIAGTMGYSIEDTAVALGIMANSGIKASQAGTSLRRIMTSLNGDIQIEGKNLGKVTIKTTNADGTMRSFADILADCRKAFAGLTDAEKTAAAKALVGQNAMSGFLTLMNASEADLASLTSAINGCTGAAEDMATTMLDNAKGDVTLFKSALEGLEITLWKLAEGGFRTVVQKATSLVDSFRNADTATQTGTLRMAALAAAAGPVMAGMGGIITMLPKLAGTLTAVSGPAALLTIGMVALGAAAIDSENTIGKTFVKGAAKARKKVLELAKSVKGQLPDITKNMAAFLESLSTGIRIALPAIIDALSAVLATGMNALSANMGNAATVAQTIVQSIASGIRVNAPQIVSAAVSLLTSMATALISNIPTVLDGMATVVTSLVKEVNKADWSGIGSQLSEAIRKALEETGTWFKKLAMGDKYTDKASWQDVGAALAGNVLTGIKTAFGNMKDFVGSLILGENYSPDDDWTSFGTKIIDKIFEGADGAVDGASKFVTGIISGIGGLFTDNAMSKASGSLATVAGSLVDHIFAEIPKLADRAGTLLEKLAALILGDENGGGIAANALSGATALVKAIFGAIETGMAGGDGTGAIQKLLDVLGKAFSEENISRITASLQGLIGAVFTGMTTVLPQFGDRAGEVIRGIIDLMFKKNESGTSLFGSALKSVETLVTTLIQSIIDFIPQAAATATNLLSALLDTLFAPQGEEGTEKSLVGDALESVKGLVDTVLRSIPDLIRTMGGSASGIITSLGEMLTRKDENGKYIASGIADALGVMIRQAIDDAVALIPSLSDAITGIIGAIGNVLTQKDENGEYLVTGIAQSLITLVTDAVSAAVSAIPALSGTIGEIIGAIGNVLTEKDENGKYVVTGIADSLSGLITQAITDLAAMIPSLGGAITDIIGAIGDVLTEKDDNGQYLVSGLADSLITLITDAVGAVVGAIPTLSGTITGIIGAIGNVLTQKDENGEYVVSGIADSLIALITDAVGAAVTAIPALAGTIGEIIGEIGKILTDRDDNGNYLITDIADSLFTLVRNAVESVKDAIPQLSGLIGEIIGEIAGILTEKDEAGNYKASGIVDSLSELVRNAIETVVGLIPSLGESVTGIIKAIGDALLSGDENGNYLVTDIADSLFALVKNAVEAAAAAIPSIADTVSGIIGAIAGILSEKDESGNYKAAGIIDSLKQMVLDAIESVIALIPTLGSSAARILTAIGEALFGKGEDEGAVSQGVTALTGIVQTIFTELNTKVIPGMGTEVGKILTTIAGLFTPEKLKDLGTGLGDLAGALLTGVVDTLVATVDTLLAIGDDADTDDMFKGVLEGIEAFAGKVIQALADAIPKVIGAGGKILGRLAEIFSPENISGMITEAQSVARGLMDTIMEAFTGEKDEANKVDLFGAFAKIVGNIIDGLKDVFTPENIEKNAINVEGFVTGLIDSISTSLSDGIETAGEEGIFGKFITLLKNLVTGIVKAIPHAFTVGEKAITAGFRIATELLHSMTEGFADGSLDIDLGALAGSFIGSLTGMLSGALDFGGEAVSAGVKLAGSLLDSLTGAFDSAISTEGVSAVGEKVRSVAQKIITGITTLLPKLFTVGGKAVSAGVKLASELVKSLADGFGSESFSADFAAMARGIVEGITEAVANLPQLLEDVLSAGAQIANAIMGSITSALQDMQASGIAASLTQAAIDLVHGLLTSVGNLGENADVKEFMKNLGAGFGSAMSMLGDFVGSIVGYILSAEGLTKIFNAGVSLGNLLLDGIQSVLSGLSNFFFSMIDSALVGMGVVKQEDIDAYRSAEALKESYNRALTDVFGEGLDAGNYADYNKAMAAAVFGMGVGGMGRSSFSQAAREWLDKNTAGAGNGWADALNGFWSDFSNEINIFKFNGEKGSITGDWVKDYMSRYLGDLIDFDPGEVFDDSLFELIAEWAKKGGQDNSNAIMEAVLTALFGSGGEETEAEAQEAVQEVTEGTVAALNEGQEQVSQAADEFGSDLGKGSMAASLRQNMGEVEEAAAEVTDAAVREFLLNMNAENGKAIAEKFIGGMVAVLDDGTVVSAAQLLGTNACNAINDILTADAGSIIGRNFGQGLANGITAMTDTVHSAAWDLGITAAEALSGAIREGSPSRVTAQTGLNFGLGFIRSIMYSADDAAAAAAQMGRTAAASLEKTVSDVRSMAADGMSVPVTARQSQIERQAIETERTAQIYAEAVSHALCNAKVVMDGESVGRLVTPTVSENIARDSSWRRFSTQ